MYSVQMNIKMNILQGLFFFIMLWILTVKCQNLKRVKRIVGGRAAAIPPEDDPVIFVTRGKRYAEIYGERDANEGYYVFKGIRYGVPPFGQNRFQRPKEMPLEGELRAIKWGPPCPQLNEEKEIIGHEDCLFLNVFLPSLPDTESTKYPVLIWIHGGGFRRGSASQYGMNKLMKKKLIVVSIQYRLGTLGFISNGTPDLPGNNGIFDMMLAVQWVKKYIEFFGGDITKITAFGHEVGASAALLLGLSKLTNDNLSGLIAMSGSSLSNFAIDKEPEKTAKFIAIANNCTTQNVLDMVRCLKEISVHQLVNTDFKIDNTAKTDGFVSSVTEIMGARPVIEGLNDNRTLPNFTPQSPENSLSLEEIPNIPLLIGVHKDEAQGAVIGDHKEEISTKISQDPEYFNHQLIPKLQKDIPIFNITKYFVPGAFSKYLNIYDNSKQTLESVKDAVEDALFNVPAFLTVNYWSKKAKTILYSFDYNGNRKFGSKFLEGSPIVSKNVPRQVVSHGDELGYIFDPNTITGERILINEKMDKKDEEVIEIFTNIVAQFATSGNYLLKEESGQEVNTYFNNDDNNYISIGEKPKIMKDFRFCQMALWIGMTQRLQSTSCNFLRTTLETVSTVVETPTKIIGKVNTKIDTVIHAVPGRGILSLGVINSNHKYLNATGVAKSGLSMLPNIGKYFKP